MHKSNFIHTQNIIFRNIDIYTGTFTHANVIKKQSVNLNKSNKGRIYGRFWRKEREGRNVIELLSQKYI